MELMQAGPSRGSESAAGAFDVGTRAQLFVDRTLVRETRGVVFTQHAAEKHPSNPVLVADREWEGSRVGSYCNVLYDAEEKLFKIWYDAGPPAGYFKTKGLISFYAVSNDGVVWDKPPVGTLEASAVSRHNAVLNGREPSVVKDLRDPDPARRYKTTCIFYNTQFPPDRVEGIEYHTMVSPDGLRWTRSSSSPISQGRDVITSYLDERLGLYVAFPKIGTEVRGHRRRVFYLTTSRDFTTWSKPELVWSPDLTDDAGSLARLESVRSLLDVPDNPNLMRTEFYGISVYPAESCTLGFPWVFTINNNQRGGTNQDGPIEIQLGASRDLVTWERHFRTPCIPLGAEGEWDSGMIIAQACGFRFGDEVRLYYGASNNTHGLPVSRRAEEKSPGKKRYSTCIGMARWKLDRFVSADGFADGGTLTTVPITHSGARLEINARTRGRGWLSVEFEDAAGRPIEGLRPSDAFRGDEIRRTITWKGEAAIPARLRSRPVRLKFRLHDCELYSFAFRAA
jgi:hypothetical protein